MTEQGASDPETEGADDSVADEDGIGESAAEDGAFPLTDDVEADGFPDFDDAADETLVERVEESDPETVARELGALRARAEELEGELDDREERIDDLESKLKRKQADFKNFKKRMERKREQERERATEDLVTRLLDVRDNLDRALEQDGDTDIRSGLETTVRQFDEVLDQENVERIEPEPAEEVDPHVHEVLVRVDSDQPEGTVAELHRPGYRMADKVLREAQVTVSDGE
jgi:molecular chaperone GrpE